MAATCTPGPGDTRDLCFAALCLGSEAHWTVIYRSDAPMTDPKIMQVDVDGRLSYMIEFYDAELGLDDADQQYSAPLYALEGSRMVDALISGSGATISFDTSAGRESVDISLRGSARALRPILAACPDPDPRRDSSDAPGSATAAPPGIAPPASEAQTNPSVANASQVQAVEDDPTFTARLSRDFGITSSEMSSVVFANDIGALGFLYHYIEGSAGSMALSVGYYSVDGTEYEFEGLVSGLYGTSPRDVTIGSREITVTTTMLRDGDPRCCPTESATWFIDPRDLSIRQQ